MNFSQAINKLQNRKTVARPSFPSGQYLKILIHNPYIYIFIPNNDEVPLTRYHISTDDFLAEDWEEVL